ncbi:phenylalanyl-tRNA synthetase, beta subunit [Parvularcula bermudensis HTCC2503]|uniref:Phenylalanyl-tRNA synthetase, beta subunit n=1 Tax=Parvularcula bermudensis (strain ATCC BAA-594 / HTCC2503 / KCTC 12087) TaxID=314260 RepID=E0TF58_PARBH|nr:hypothetical protein [Parvularcula bermudensis]ADM08976.1 phenylalanyl-tRNA synthetase, beta subunit [Parvularcula bermudensis HTCC2503]
MGSVGFLLVIAIYAVVFGWYAWSVEMGQTGTGGVLGLDLSDDETREPRDARPTAETALDRVRARSR